MSNEYDILLFGATGFTGRLAAEHLLAKKYDGLKWGVCGRSADKIKQVMGELDGGSEVPTEICDLVCGDDSAKLETLKAVVAKTKVVISSAGPFEKYGLQLVQVCAELGVHYADITGETDFVRKTITDLHETCRKTGATLVSHCGHDCIPWDLAVYILHLEAKKAGKKIAKVRTFVDLKGEVSGGTAQTIKYQLLEKKREKGGDRGVDPLATTMESASEASKFVTKNDKKMKDRQVVKEIDDRGAAPWVMSPVMANCVKRSNALLGYNEEMTFGDAKLEGGFVDKVKDNLSTWKTGLGVVLGAYVHPWFCKAPGDGPSRETMEQSNLRLWAFAELDDGSQSQLKYSIDEDPGYLNTAKMLVESGVALLKTSSKPAGVLSPAAAIGDVLIERCKAEIGHKIEIV